MGIFILNTLYPLPMTLQQADHIASHYSYLIGRNFMHQRYGTCEIHTVDPFRLDDLSYTVVLKYDVFRPPCISEFFGHQSVRKRLLEYLLENKIEFNPKRFGLE